MASSSSTPQPSANTADGSNSVLPNVAYDCGPVRIFHRQGAAIQMLARDCLHYSTILYQNSAYFINCRNQAGVEALSGQEAGLTRDGHSQLAGGDVFAKQLIDPSDDHLNVLKKFSKVGIFAPPTNSTAMLVGKYKYKDALEAELKKGTVTDPNQKGELEDHLAYLKTKGVDDVAVIAFRGTNTFDDVRKDLMFHQVEFCKVDNESVKVHKGFNDYFNVLKAELDLLLGRKDLASLPVLFTGHSLGGALSLMATLRTTLQLDLPPEQGVKNSREVGFITFGCPRVGDIPFCKALDKKCNLRLRLWAGSDPVVKVPLRTLHYPLRKVIEFITGEVPGGHLDSYFETEVKYHLHLGRKDTHKNYPLIYNIFDHHPDFYSQLMVKDDMNLEPPVGRIIGDLPWFSWFKAGCDGVMHLIGHPGDE